MWKPWQLKLYEGAIEQEIMHVMGCRGPDDQAMMHLSAPEHHMASMAAALQPDMHHQKQDQVCLILSSLSPFLLCIACIAQESSQFGS